MNAGQTPARSWNTRRSEKARRVASLPVQGKVIPTDGLVDALEKLIAPKGPGSTVKGTVVGTGVP